MLFMHVHVLHEYVPSVVNFSFFINGLIKRCITGHKGKVYKGLKMIG